jgi:predicted deacylase
VVRFKGVGGQEGAARIGAVQATPEADAAETSEPVVPFGPAVAAQGAVEQGEIGRGMPDADARSRRRIHALFASGGKRRVYAAEHTKLTPPGQIGISHAIEFVAEKPGKHVVIFGAIHGDEPVGPAAIARVHDLLVARGIDLASGRVTFILGNPQGYVADKIYRDKNLNRIMDAALLQQDHGAEGARAREIDAYLGSKKPNFVLDLHSVSVGDHAMAVYCDDPASERLALAVSPLEVHNVATADTGRGMLIARAREHGAEAMIVECGGHRSPNGIGVALEHIARMLGHAGVLDRDALRDLVTLREPARDVEIYLDKASIPAGPNFHFTLPEVATGTFIAKGQEYAVDDLQRHVADEDCWLMMPMLKLAPGQPDAGFLVKKRVVERDVT